MTQLLSRCSVYLALLCNCSCQSALEVAYVVPVADKIRHTCFIFIIRCLEQLHVHHTSSVHVLVSFHRLGILLSFLSNRFFMPCQTSSPFTHRGSHTTLVYIIINKQSCRLIILYVFLYFYYYFQFILTNKIAHSQYFDCILSRKEIRKQYGSEHVLSELKCRHFGHSTRIKHGPEL